MVALLTDAGKMVEWVKHSSYGVPFALPAGDTDSDGDFDAGDLTSFGGAYDVREDVNLDGTVDTSDPQDALTINGGYVTLGRGALSNPATANRKGYAGYEYDPTFEGAGGGGVNGRHLYHVRHRVYDADVGRWTRRDPLGYLDGMSLYEYISSEPLLSQDPSGLLSLSCGSCITDYAQMTSDCLSDEDDDWTPRWPRPGEPGLPRRPIRPKLPPVPPGEVLKWTPCPKPAQAACQRACKSHGGKMYGINCYISNKRGIIVVCSCYDPKRETPGCKSLYTEYKALCAKPGCRKADLEAGNCDKLREGRQNRVRCLTARQFFQQKCITRGVDPDGDRSHDSEIESIRRSIANCDRMVAECEARKHGANPPSNVGIGSTSLSID